MYIHAVAGLFVLDTYMLSRNKLNDAIPIFETRRLMATKTAFNAATCFAQNFEKISSFRTPYCSEASKDSPGDAKCVTKMLEGAKIRKLGAETIPFVTRKK